VVLYRLLIICVLLGGLLESAFAEQKVLRSCVEARALKDDINAEGNDFEISGTFIRMGLDGAVLHDGHVGIWLRLKGVKKLPRAKTGYRVWVRGKTERGQFAPVLAAKEMKIIATNLTLPDPKPATHALLQSPAVDCQWLVVEGIVLSNPKKDGSKSEYLLPLMTSAGFLRLALHPDLKDMVKRGDRLRVRSIAVARFDKLRRFRHSLLRVVSKEDILEVQAETTSGGLRHTSLTGALTFSTEPGPPSRIVVEAQVTGVINQNRVFVSDQNSAAFIEGTGESLSIGDKIEIIGFPDTHQPGVIAYAEWRKLSIGPLLQPKTLDAPPEVEQDHSLVKMRGQVVSASMDPRVLQTEIRSAEGWSCFVETPSEWTKQNKLHWPLLEVGSELQVTGLLQLQFADNVDYKNHRSPQRIVLWPRVIEDIQVLRAAPWPRSIVWLSVLSASATAALIAAGMMYWRARRKLVQQKMLQERTKLISQERARLARELHDNLAQGLNTVSIRLEAVRSKFLSAPESAQRHLECAHEEVRDSLVRVREAIHHLRPQLLQKRGLHGALEEIALRLSKGLQGPEVKLHLQPTLKLEADQEVAILYLMQEALTNALQHAKASCIQITLSQQKETVILTVQDDGQGLPQDTSALNKPGHLGLTSMKERAAAVGAEFQIASNTEGTSVRVCFPLPKLDQA
jgi:signal transduction histidine kinase